ncbi:hypothetical protein C8R43DRAFT_871412, partial [Mycena crocata]
EYLRETMDIPDTVPINLWAIPDTDDGSKPDHRLEVLLQLTLYGSRFKKLTLQGIYAALIERFEWYKSNQDTSTWKHSIRHDLSFYREFYFERDIEGRRKWAFDLQRGVGPGRPRKPRNKGHGRTQNKNRPASSARHGPN